MRKKISTNPFSILISLFKFLLLILFAVLVGSALFMGMKLMGREDEKIVTTPVEEKPQTNESTHTIKDLGLSFEVPKDYTVTFENQMNLDTKEPYAYTFTVQNYKDAPTKDNNYQLYGTYQFDTEKVDISVFDDLKKELLPESIIEGSVWSFPTLNGQLEGERSKFVTYILKDGHLLSLYTSEPTVQNQRITESIIRTFILK